MSSRSLLAHAYTGGSLFQLFMICVFPIHVWALLMGFRDFSWVAERTTVWDALGLVSYSLTFALMESAGIFLILVLAGLLIPNRFDPEKKLALMGTAFLIVILWAIGGQLYSMMGYWLPNSIVAFLRHSNHPLRFIWGGVFVPVCLTAAASLFSIQRWHQYERVTLEVFDRISTVSLLYLVLDFVGVVIVIIRNVQR